MVKERDGITAEVYALLAFMILSKLEAALCSLWHLIKSSVGTCIGPYLAYNDLPLKGESVRYNMPAP